MKQTYRIAGLVVEMDTFGRTEQQAKPYMCEYTTPDMTISADWRAYQQIHPHLSAEECEYILTGATFYKRLIQNNGIMLHASAVVVDGQAYLFSAPSGTGKSTHTRLWLKKFGERAHLLNDDKPALRQENGTWYAYGTPWSGKDDISVNERVPVAGICFIRQGLTNRIDRFCGSRAVFAFLDQTARPAETDYREKIMDVLDHILDSVPVWQMECNMDLEAAEVSSKTMMSV
ncbi:MAG: hypothetical protein J6K84_03240 [Oscillospiraceae bacterium]|nr:hypothetical protein [Oscillospiraceae bacterium]